MDETQDLDGLQKAIKLYEDDRLLEAADILRSIPQTSLNDESHSLLEKADDVEKFLRDIKGKIDQSKTVDMYQHSDHDSASGRKMNTECKRTDDSNESDQTSLKQPQDKEMWVKQSFSGSNGRPIEIFYKLNSDGFLTLKVESPVEKSLIVPLVSVINESELYSSWLPQWTFPKLKLFKSEKLKQCGRASQIIHMGVEVPWPMKKREVILSAFAIDDIDGKSGDIIVRIKSLNAGDEDGLVPPVDDKIHRIKYTGGFVFSKSNEDIQDISKTAEDQILTTFLVYIDSKLLSFPKALLDFVLRHAFGLAWKKLFKIAEEVRDGVRPAHAEAIHTKGEVFYDWVEKRIADMIHSIPQ